MQLIAAIVASEPFSDLVAEFIEDNEASNKNLGQYFTLMMFFSSSRTEFKIYIYR
jgi:hypothetical protein